MMKRTASGAPAGQKYVADGQKRVFAAPFLNRLRTVVDAFESRGEASMVAGVVPDQLARYLRGDAEPKFETLARLCEPKGVSLDWLWSGSGDKSGGSGSPDDEFINVPFFEIEASSGHGSFASGQIEARNVAFRADWLRSLIGASFDKLVVLRNRGDSNAPTINDGDAILVDRAVERLSDDAFYVFRVDDSLLVKLIERQVDGRIVLRSRNPSYSLQELDRTEAERLQIFGRVRWRGGGI